MNCSSLHNRRHWILKVLLISIIMLLGLPFRVNAQEDVMVVKAVYLERFTRFVDWPESVDDGDTTKHFVIGVIGNKDFVPLLEEVYANQKVKNRTVSVRYFNAPQDIVGCHLLFVTTTNNNKLSQILSVTEEQPILTVGDTRGYAEAGVLINLSLVDNKIRFAINDAAVRKSGLRLSSLLLQWAQIVGYGGQE